MKNLLFVVSLFIIFSLNAQAAPVEAYDCQVLLVAADVPSGGDWKFQAAAVTEDSHGGKTQKFVVGVHEIEIIANRQWLGVSWVRDGKKIAEGVFVLGQSDQSQNRVAILYDPSDSGDQVSLSCDLKN